MEYQGIDGFLGSRASLAYDVAFLLELAVIPLCVWSLELLLIRRRYLAHKRLQLFITAIFAVAVAVFTLEFFAYDWQVRAAGASIPGITYMTLTIHLAFLVITTAMWAMLLVQALRKIPSPPEPCDFGPYYIFGLVLVCLQLFISTLTGWEFYLLAFCY